MDTVVTLPKNEVHKLTFVPFLGFERFSSMYM